MQVKSIDITNYSVISSRNRRSRYIGTPVFGSAAAKRIPELDTLIKESRMFYKEIYHRPDSIVKIPDMSPSSIVIEDSLPLVSPHLLLFYKDKFSYSLAEKYDNSTFHSDFKTLLYTLRKLYPEQNIIFFEHGSGNKNINGQNKKINAGKSVTVAHGHFCVLPKNTPSFLNELLLKTKLTLSDNNWANVENVPVIKNESIPNTYAIYKNFSGKDSQTYPPYLTISEFDSKTNCSKSAIFIQQNIEAHTPSQCLRKIFSETVLNENNSLFWDWKRFFCEVFSGNKSDFIQKRIKQVSSGSADFENRLRCIV